MSVEKPTPPEEQPPQEELIRHEKHKEDAGEAWTDKAVEIPEVGEFSYKEKRVNFPEDLVAETGGVKGYIRREFAWGELGKMLHLTPEQISKFMDDVAEAQKLQKEEGWFRYVARMEEIENEYHLDEHWESALQDNVRNILRQVTDGNFPDQTYWHMFNSVWGTEGALEEYKRRGLLLEKAFDPAIDWAKEEKGFASVRSFAEFNSQSALPEKEISLQSIDPTSPDYPDHYYINIGKGVSVTQKGTPWKGTGDFLQQNIFGFGQKNKAFRQYLEKTRTLLEEISRRAIETRKQTSELPENNDARNQLNGRFTSVKPRIESINAMLQGDLGAINWHSHMDDESHPQIPVVLNHPSIPELRWCHADYAVIPTKKGWNVIEMVTD